MENQKAPIDSNLIDLQAAHATQLSNNGVKGEWHIRKNITNEDMQKLPAHFSDQEVFSIMDFAKKYELIAFNEGIKFQKGNQNQYLLSLIAEKDALIKEILTENERITNILETAL